MISASPTARLSIDLAALSHNYKALKTRAGVAEVAPVVKADAYGLGMAAIAPYLAHQGARTFFVARLQEGVALRRLLGADPIIYVLDGLTETAAFAAHRLRPVINTPAQYHHWISGANDLAAAVHIDTGMNRLGIRPEDMASLPDAGSHHLALVMSHLSCGDEPDHPLNPQQLAAFREAAARFPRAQKSLANTAGAWLGQDYGFDLIRPGIGLYGGGPFGAAHADIRTVAHLSARVLQVHHIKAGETVGYGATFTAPRDMSLATIGLGYADGLLRSFSGGFVTVKGERRPLTGRISMDLCTCDVSGLEVAADDWVEVLGSSQNLDEVAARAGTIGYELLTRLGPRIARQYT